MKAKIKKILSKFILMNEFCHSCGNKQKLIWTAPNDMWNKIMGGPNGVLCVFCFDKKVKNQMNTLLRWIPIDIKEEQAKPIVLTEEEAVRFLDALENPRPLSEKLKEAARSYKEAVETGKLIIKS